MRDLPNCGNCAVVVAHPDDETLWAGGLILLNGTIDWKIYTLCRSGDPDRSPRFYAAVKMLGACGAMADLDDGPEQTPLDNSDVDRTVASLLGGQRFDVIFTHGLSGEYTRHRRHEETAASVIRLWRNGGVAARALRSFAYEDGNRSYLPKAAKDADIKLELPEEIHRRKYRIITEVYGFSQDSFEAKTTPVIEAFNVVHHQ